MKNLLVIGHTFPEPATTAAGIRMMQLIELFANRNFEITFASTAALSEKSANLELQNISIQNILLNDSSFDVFIKKLNPEIVIFDRYISEEQFGWRVSEQCPNALKILDTEDLHFLRKARQEAVRKNLPLNETNLFSVATKRELASILRCDLSLIISEYEMQLLQNTFKISSDILFYLPFLLKDTSETLSSKSYQQRKNFMTIGNLLHAPNVDSVLQLKQIWPAIKKQIPESELHIYGAYAPQQVMQLHNEKEGFHIKGWAEDLEDVFTNYRLQIAPIRFGAGLKGKLVDAMRFGLPSVTSEVGAEGLCGELPFGGEIVASKEEFANAAIQLYSEENIWKKAQQNGFNIIENRFAENLFLKDFVDRVESISQNIEIHRQENFIGQILQYQNMQATKYMSKWIESKNSLPQNASPVCFANNDEVRDEYK